MKSYAGRGCGFTRAQGATALRHGGELLATKQRSTSSWPTRYVSLSLSISNAVTDSAATGFEEIALPTWIL
jgi:hypothetical protein